MPADETTPDEATSPDAITLLRRQHVEVEELFRTMEELQPVAQGSGTSYLEQRRQITELIIRKLMLHSGIEEEVFYPALRADVDGGGELMSKAVEQHSHAEHVAGMLDGKSPDNVDFDGDLRELIAGVREHIRFEEGEIFPAIEGAVQFADLQRLGEKLAKAEKSAPTRPHPHTPPATSGMGKLLAKGAAVADRMRDVASGRTRG